MVLMCSHLKTPSKVNVFLFNFSDRKYINNELKVTKKIHKILRQTFNISDVPRRVEMEDKKYKPTGQYFMNQITE